MSSTQDRQYVGSAGIVGAMFCGSVFYIGYFMKPFPIPHISKPLDRLLYTLQWQTPSVLMLLAGIQVVAIKRLYSNAINPLSGKGDQYIQVDSRYLQNTLEQLIINAVGQLILMTYLSEQQMHVIPVLVFLFVVGRAAFWIGYRRSYIERAFGFTVTIIPNLTMYITLCVCFVRNLGQKTWTS